MVPSVFVPASNSLFVRGCPSRVSCTPHGGQGGPEAACCRDMATAAKVCRLNPCGFDMFSKRGLRPGVPGPRGVVLGRALTIAVKPGCVQKFHGNSERGDLQEHATLSECGF